MKSLIGSDVAWYRTPANNSDQPAGKGKLVAFCPDAMNKMQAVIITDEGLFEYKHLTHVRVGDNKALPVADEERQSFFNQLTDAKEALFAADSTIKQLEFDLKNIGENRDLLAQQLKEVSTGNDS